MLDTFDKSEYINNITFERSDASQTIISILNIYYNDYSNVRQSQDIAVKQPHIGEEI